MRSNFYSLLGLAAVTLALLACFAIALAASACGGGGGATSQRATPGTIASGSPTTSAPTLSNEHGADPVFWRTPDNFTSVEPGKPYKVLFRITGGYAEPTLRITATCQTCRQAGQHTPVVIESQMAQPVGQDLPGSYYPTSLDLPAAGRWELVLTVGDRPVIIPVEVHSAS